jgi:hypothetical protein
MRFTSTRIALAIAGSALLMGSPLAQASADYFPTSQATMGGHLYVADPTQDVTIQLIYNQNSTNDFGILQWKDGVDGEWHDLYTGTSTGSIKHDAQNMTFTIDSSLLTSGEIYLGYVAADNLHDYNHGKDTWYYQTGEANTSGRNTDGLVHAAVVYDYQGQIKAICGYQPITPSGDNVALVGFEDYYNYKLGHCTTDFDDFMVFVTNVQASPAPEPETYAMLLAGLGVVGLVARRRRKQV